MNTKYYIIGGLILFAAGLGTGLYVKPAKVVTKTNTVTNDVIHDHIITVTHTVTLPNGQKDTTTTTTNNTVINDKSSTNSSTVIVYNKPQWKVNALAGLSASNLGTPIYGAQVERRILGPIFAGAWGTSDQRAGISLGIEF